MATAVNRREQIRNIGSDLNDPICFKDKDEAQHDEQLKTGELKAIKIQVLKHNTIRKTKYLLSVSVFLENYHIIFCYNYSRHTKCV